MKEPLALDKFEASTADFSALLGEVITVEKNGFTMNEIRRLAIYFTTHRTRLGDASRLKESET